MLSVDGVSEAGGRLRTRSQNAFGPREDLPQNEGLLLSVCVYFDLSLCQVAVFIHTVHHQISDWTSVMSQKHFGVSR